MRSPSTPLQSAAREPFAFLNVRADWLEQRVESCGRKAALAPLVPVAWSYGFGAALHRAAYASGLVAPRRIECRVVSIGNLVVGGSGKTPLAAWLASALLARGRRVALASRGYGRVAGEPVTVVSDGRRVLSRVDEAGDEPMLLAARSPGIPVLVGDDRGLVGLRAISEFDVDVLVLDDGFQHHRLHRDIDLVTFDGRLGLGNGHVLPRGPLREMPRALRRADAIGVIDGPLPERDEMSITRHAPGTFRFSAQRRPCELRPLRGGPGLPPGELAGKKVGLIEALAQPRGFRRTLEALGAEVIAERVFRDHHAYEPQDVRGLLEEASLWVTTEKDAPKIIPTWIGAADVRVLSIDLAVESPELLLGWLDSRLR